MTSFAHHKVYITIFLNLFAWLLCISFKWIPYQDSDENKKSVVFWGDDDLHMQRFHIDSVPCQHALVVIEDRGEQPYNYFVHVTIRSVILHCTLDASFHLVIMSNEKLTIIDVVMKYCCLSPRGNLVDRRRQGDEWGWSVYKQEDAEGMVGGDTTREPISNLSHCVI